jgi:hypothetical protein
LIIFIVNHQNTAAQAFWQTLGPKAIRSAAAYYHSLR